MKAYIVTKAGAETMRRRLGETADLFMQSQYLPFARNRQESINRKKPGGFTILANYARRKRQPERYMKKIIKCVDKAIGIINMLHGLDAEREAKRKQKEFFESHGLKLAGDYDRQNRDKYAKVRGMFELWRCRLSQGLTDDEIWSTQVPLWCEEQGAPIPSLV